eukprot:TRINITY_DN13263_c0_g1_i1.p1 TRINITY_DN13263_c0_g1~~TRINITY_DN13263_c0_g1_i1.p1  ORF type:complete len:116 (-),score=27.32 TRINITY_DN13263_c0_g1_i1:13-360(-)
MTAGDAGEERISERDGWRQRVALLEEELRQTSEAVQRLRQRELWFELQLARQREVHGEPLDSLLAEVTDLQKLLMTSRKGAMAKMQTISRGQSPVSERTNPLGSSAASGRLLRCD